LFDGVMQKQSNCALSGRPEKSLSEAQEQCKNKETHEKQEWVQRQPHQQDTKISANLTHMQLLMSLGNNNSNTKAGRKIKSQEPMAPATRKLT